jgi:hypothetical protein
LNKVKTKTTHKKIKKETINANKLKDLNHRNTEKENRNADKE